MYYHVFIMYFLTKRWEAQSFFVSVEVKGQYKGGSRMKTTYRNKIRIRILPILLLLVFAAGIAGADQVHADALIWHEVNMKPGDTYDVGKAKANTTVFIEKAGKYTLKGKSRNVF